MFFYFFRFHIFDFCFGNSVIFIDSWPFSFIDACLIFSLDPLSMFLSINFLRFLIFSSFFFCFYLSCTIYFIMLNINIPPFTLFST